MYRTTLDLSRESQSTAYRTSYDFNKFRLKRTSGPLRIESPFASQPKHTLDVAKREIFNNSASSVRNIMS